MPSISNRMKRISLREVEELGQASVKLAEVAAAIRLSKGAHVPACIQLLIEANDIIIGIRDRALKTVQHILARADDRLDAAAREKAAEDDITPAGWPVAAEKRLD
jgi:hypothetical protein